MSRPASPAAALTPRQQEVLDLIDSSARRDGFAPTVRELGDALGIRSPNGVCFHLNTLRRKGVLTWTEGKSRSLRVLGRGAGASGWRPVGDGEPPAGGQYIACYQVHLRPDAPKERHVTAATWQPDCGWKMLGFHEIRDVTHWMPLPEPPTGDER